MSSMTCTCIRILEAACVSTVSTARSFGFEAVCIRNCSTPFFLYSCLKLCHARFVLVCHGCFYMPLKGLKVYMMRTKRMVSEPGLDLLCNFGAFSCSVFRSGAGVSNIKCFKCEHLVHIEMQRC